MNAALASGYVLLRAQCGLGAVECDVRGGCGTVMSRFAHCDVVRVAAGAFCCIWLDVGVFCHGFAISRFWCCVFSMTAAAVGACVAVWCFMLFLCT